MNNIIEIILSNLFRVGEWHVDPGSGRIQCKGAEIKLEPKVMSVLLCLAQHPGKVISREALEATVWADMIVGYDALASAIIKFRKMILKKWHLGKTVLSR